MIIKAKVNGLMAQINFISLRPGSDETGVIHTKSVNK